MKRSHLILVNLLSVVFTISSIRAAEYHIGPGQTHANINDIAMHDLSAGDTVYIHWRPEPYREKFRLSGVGTEDQPIRVIGIPNEQGQRPIIDGENATTHPDDVWPIYGDNQSTGDVGVIIVFRGPGRPYVEKPSHILIQGLEVTHGRYLYQFTASDGSTRQWGGTGIWISGANDVHIIDCKIHDCGNGLFSKSGDDEPSTTRRMLVRQCHFENNSENSKALDENATHNTYTECAGIIYEENYFGPTRFNSDGANLKDRSSNSIIRYNYVTGGTRLLDLVEAQESYPMVRQSLQEGDLSYRSTQVYGNILYSGPGHATRPVHYGGDSSDPPYENYRKGTLYFHHNTIVFRRDRDETWRVAIFDLETDDESAVIWNNIFHLESFTPNALPSYFYLVDRHGHHTFGSNWVTQGYGIWDNGLGPIGNGTITGEENLLVGISPEFLNITAEDFRLRKTSPARDVGTVLPENAHSVVAQYVYHRDIMERNAHGVPDFGAFEYMPITDPVAPTAQPQSLRIQMNDSIELTLTGIDLNDDPLDFTISTPPANGTLTGNPPVLNYQPDESYTGPDSFQFTVTDGTFVSEPATISLTIVEQAVEIDIYSLTVHNGEGTGNYLAGDTVTITAVPPNAGDTFLSWSGAGVSDSTAVTTTMVMPAENSTVTARFEPAPIIARDPKIFNIGPGMDLETLSELIWTDMVPGDTIRLHWRPEPYREKVLISARGANEQPIRLIGIKNAKGQRPVVSGENAITGPHTDFADWETARRFGLISIRRTHSQAPTHKPGYIEISSLELRDIEATENVWEERAAAIRLEGAEHVTIRDCVIYNVCTGIGSSAQVTGESSLNREIKIEACHIYQTGTPEEYNNANIGITAVGLTIRHCRLDPPVEGSFGYNILDRSAGTAIESCRIEGAPNMIHLLEPFGSQPGMILNDPRAENIQFTGNLVLATHPSAAIPLAIDRELPPNPGQAPKGKLKLHQNTFVISNGTYRATIPDRSPSFKTEMFNNIIWRTGDEIIRLANDDGSLDLGINWISPGYEWSDDTIRTGDSKVLSNPENDPKLDSNMIPLPLSQARDASDTLYAVTQFFGPASGIPRYAVNGRHDLGAFEAGLEPLPTITPLRKVYAGPDDLWIQDLPNTNYLIEWSEDLKSWQPLTARDSDSNGVLTIPNQNQANLPMQFYRAKRNQ